MKNQYFTVKYNNLLFRTILSFIAALFIVKYGVDVNIFDALSMPSFYLSVCQSFFIAFLLTLWVHGFTMLLDRVAPWEINKWLRMIFQAVICWAMPCILSYLMANLYFHYRGVDISNTDYDLMELPLIQLLLLFLSYYYYIKYHSIRNAYQLSTLNLLLEQNSAGSEQSDTPPLVLSLNGNVTKLDTCREVACFYKAQDGYWIKTMKGDCFPLPPSLIQIEKVYGGHYFFKLNRALIINRKAIKNHITEAESGSVRVEMYRDIGPLEHSSTIELLTVKSKHAEEFIVWFDEKG